MYHSLSGSSSEFLLRILCQSVLYRCILDLTKLFPHFSMYHNKEHCKPKKYWIQIFLNLLTTIYKSLREWPAEDLNGVSNTALSFVVLLHFLNTAWCGRKYASLLAYSNSGTSSIRPSLILFHKLPTQIIFYKISLHRLHFTKSAVSEYSKDSVYNWLTV